MRNRPSVPLLLAAVLAVLIFTMVALVDISRWPPRPRFYIFIPSPQPAPPSGATRLPPPAAPAPATPTAPVHPAPTAPAVDTCTPDRLGSDGSALPAMFGPVQFRAVPLGPGRGYLEGTDPTLSPDGREVAFVREGEDGKSHIWASSLDGTALRQLKVGTNPAQPTWSPDGTRIAFASNGFIWVINRDGSDLRRLTTKAESMEHAAPAWSPDGKRLTFVAGRLNTQAWDIWVINADGSEAHRVTDLSGYEYGPAFSPDGKQIVFSSTSPGGPGRALMYQLMITNLDGTGLCRLPTTGVEDTSPDWSRQGIVYLRGCCEPWWIPASKSLTSYPLLHDRKGTNPAWSADGSKVVYETEDGHIFLFDVRTRTLTPLTQRNVLTVAVLVKPGQRNVIRPTDGPVAVAVLSAPWFYPVTRLDRKSIRFGPAGGERSPVSCAPSEVNDDGVPDLVCQFDVALAFKTGHTEGIFKAAGTDGLLFEGRDAVEIVY